LTSNHANFIITESLQDRIVIKDIGPWDKHPTVTNDAEWVVSQLVDADFPGPERSRLFYYDSEGHLDELLIQDGKFAGFKVGDRAQASEPTMKVKTAGKCTRCGRALKRTYVVDGVPYGPICVRKLFGSAITITRDDGKVLYGTTGKPARKRKEEPAEDTSQLGFFDDERTDQD
jgi:hypothetical protein